MTLFDTSVVIDARDSDSPFHTWARQQIARAVSADEAMVNTVVLAESSVRSSDRDVIPVMLEGFGMNLVSLPISAAKPAARAYEIYLDRLAKEGKKPASKIPLPDFLIGAHAEAESLKLVTRDPDRVRTYFPAVALVTP